MLLLIDFFPSSAVFLVGGHMFCPRLSGTGLPHGTVLSPLTLYDVHKQLQDMAGRQLSLQMKQPTCPLFGAQAQVMEASYQLL